MTSKKILHVLVRGQLSFPVSLLLQQQSLELLFGEQMQQEAMDDLVLNVFPIAMRMIQTLLETVTVEVMSHTTPRSVVGMEVTVLLF